MGHHQLIAACSVLSLVTGCGLFLPKETRYLMSAKGHASQTEVMEHLGKPIDTKVSPTGDVVWIYHVRVLQPGNRMTAPGAWCDEYVLAFDQQEVLRDWLHRSYFHGGETMPAYCVPDSLSANR